MNLVVMLTIVSAVVFAESNRFEKLLCFYHFVVFG